MKLSTRLALGLRVLFAAPEMAAALGSGDAANMFTAFNNAFLSTGSSTFYKTSLQNQSPDGYWVGALDNQAAEDAYDVTGDPAYKTLVNNLCETWIANNEPPWDYINYNDDVGWDTLALIRGYRITGNTDFLNIAEYGFNFAYNRGWDTQSNGGGIWECQPSACGSSEKDALSNDSLGKVACILYQSTHNTTYLNYCRGIYDWVWNHIYDPSTGAMNFGVYSSGQVDTALNAYNQGTWLDYAGLVYEITGDQNVKNDAQKVLDFAKNSLTTNGIFSNHDPSLNTWADDMARGVARFLSDNRLWGNYYSWVVANANGILANRRADIGLTWNAWDQPTPEDSGGIPSIYLSAVAWLWWTPVTLPDQRVGIHTITNQKTGLAIDSAGTFGNGAQVVQWAQNNGQNQRWQLTQNSDTSWNIINLSTWESLDCPGGSTANNITLIQWQPSRDDNQRWWVDIQSDGSYKIWNKQSGKALDGASSTQNGAPLIQWDWNGGSQQRWILQ